MKYVVFLLSSTEENYIATCLVNYDVYWLHKVATNMGDMMLEPTIMYYDS